MKYKKTSAEDRKRICEAFKEEQDWKAIAKTLGINIKTAYKWIFNNQVAPKKKRGRLVSKKRPEIVTAILSAIEENSSETLSQLKAPIRTQFNLDVSVNTVKNWLDMEFVTVKAVRPTIDNMNRHENKVKRAAYVQQYFQNRSEGRTLIWIDETNFNLYCKRKEGRSKIGTRASVVLPASKGANLHCIGATSSTNVVLFTTRKGAFKGRTVFNGVIDNVIVIDNAPAHARLEQLLEEHPHLQILRLAPYSYLLNPI